MGGLWYLSLIFMYYRIDLQIHIHTILHQNKNDEHARGHIGTELNNKAESIMQVEVNKEDKSISIVEAVHIRDKEFEPFAFRINEEALPELVESYAPKEKKVGRPKKEPRLIPIKTFLKQYTAKLLN